MLIVPQYQIVNVSILKYYVILKTKLYVLSLKNKKISAKLQSQG